jgi:hypothetical protein
MTTDNDKKQRADSRQQNINSKQEGTKQTGLRSLRQGDSPTELQYNYTTPR